MPIPIHILYIYIYYRPTYIYNIKAFGEVYRLIFDVEFMRIRDACMC